MAMAVAMYRISRVSRNAATTRLRARRLPVEKAHAPVREAGSASMAEAAPEAGDLAERIMGGAILARAFDLLLVGTDPDAGIRALPPSGPDLAGVGALG